MKLSEQAYLDISKHAVMSAARAWQHADQLFDEPADRASLAMTMAVEFFGLTMRMIQLNDGGMNASDEETAFALASTLIQAVRDKPPPRLQKVAI